MKRFQTYLIFFLFLFLMLPADAQEPSQRYVNITLIPEKTNVSPGETILVGARLDIAPGWHVYWINPGDSGLAPKITWKDQNIESKEIIWPLPDKIAVEPLANYGYHDQVTLLQNLHLPESLPDGPITLTTHIELLVCNDICIPESGDYSLTLNDPATPPQNNTALLEAELAKIPQPLPGAFSFEETRDENNQTILVLNLSPQNETLASSINPKTAEFYPLDWGIIKYAASPQVEIKNGTITISHERDSRDLAELETISGILAFTNTSGQRQGYTITATNNTPAATNDSKTTDTQNQIIPAAKSASTPTAENTTLAIAFVYALLGGLILNLMPCVFPILSLKVLSLVKIAEKQPATARLHGIAYTAGIILSFLLIGLALVILKQAGSVIGWGFQLQNPAIVGLLAYILFALGLNLAGFFEFSLRFGNFGQNFTQGQNPINTFFTGILATIVATPCTAPFMGAALGFALVQNTYTGMLVFAALGLGLALPYLLMAFIPAASKLLPRPGPWMEYFRQFLAFPMFGAAIWLVWVLSMQSGSMGVFWILLGMLSIAFAVWLARIGLKYAALIFILLPGLFLMTLGQAPHTSSEEQTYQFGESFSPEKLSNLLEGNQPIFVEMTAAWCITCKVNHAIAIDIASTRDLFAKNNVQYLIGDWTNRDEVISNYLNSFNRSGVPLYIFYPAPDPVTKKRPEPKILPQVLTPSIVKQAIEE